MSSEDESFLESGVRTSAKLLAGAISPQSINEVSGQLNRSTRPPSDFGKVGVHGNPADPAAGTIIKSDCAGRTRYTAQYKREVPDAFESSSLSAPAFVMQCGVKYPTFAACIAGRRRSSPTCPATSP